MTYVPAKAPLALILSLAVGSAVLAQQPVIPAATLPVPGARPGDKDLGCADVAAERASIEADIAQKANRAASGAKIRKGVFGFARTFAGIAAPGMLGGLGGGSVLGGIAAQSAGSAAGQAIASTPTASPASATAAGASSEQQARLDRLGKIGAYRQCAP